MDALSGQELRKIDAHVDSIRFSGSEAGSYLRLIDFCIDWADSRLGQELRKIDAHVDSIRQYRRQYRRDIGGVLRIR